MVVKERENELILLWKEPTTRRRYAIGRLWQELNRFCFEYESTEAFSVKDAMGKGFELFKAMPELGKRYEAPSLFPIFSVRIPPVKRPDVLELLEAFNVQEPNEMDLLRITGGRLPTDTFEFLEPISSSEELREVTFPVAGWRYYSGDSAATELKSAAHLKLELDKNNLHDPHAIRILSPSGIMLGFVPALYSRYLDQAVLEGKCQAEVRSYNPGHDVQNRLIVSISARVPELPKDFHRRLNRL